MPSVFFLSFSLSRRLPTSTYYRRCVSGSGLAALSNLFITGSHERTRIIAFFKIIAFRLSLSLSLSLSLFLFLFLSLSFSFSLSPSLSSSLHLKSSGTSMNELICFGYQQCYTGESQQPWAIFKFPLFLGE